MNGSLLQKPSMCPWAVSKVEYGWARNLDEVEEAGRGEAFGGLVHLVGEVALLVEHEERGHPRARRAQQVAAPLRHLRERVCVRERERKRERVRERQREGAKRRASA